jgi:hypothetical protein
MAVRNLSLQPSKTAYYRFTETSGTSIADASGGAHTGTLTGSVALNQPSLLTNDNSPAAKFSGGRVTSNNFLTLTSGLTLSGIFSLNSFVASYRYSLLSAGETESGFFQLYYLSGPNTFNYSFTATDGTTVAVNFPNLAQGQLNRVYHIAVTHDFPTKTIKMYQDGVLVSTQTYTKEVRASGAQAVTVGNTNVDAQIDEALFAGDRVLTDDEVYNLFRASRGVDAAANVIYVSPTGNYRATGSYADPIDLYTALRTGYAKPGQSYYLKGGTYRTPSIGLTSTLTGKPGAPIKVKAEPGQRVIIDGADVPLGILDYNSMNMANIFTAQGSYCEFWNIEITYSNPDLATGRRHSRPTGLVVTGSNQKFIGVWIYDAGVGVFPSESATDLEFHGCLFFNNGWWLQKPDLTREPHGHNVYIQNDDTVHRKLFKNSVMWGAASYGYHAYGQNITSLRGLDLDGLVSFSNGVWQTTTGGGPNIYFGPLVPVKDITVKNSVSYHKTGVNGSNYVLGRLGDPHEGLVFTNNKSFGAGRVSFIDFSHVTVSDNLFIDTRPSAGSANGWYFTYMRPNKAPNTYDTTNKGYWTGTRNTYAGFGYSPSMKIWNEDGVAGYNLSEWKALTNIDSDATIRNTDSSPYTSPLVYYFPNEYEQGKGFLTVFNPPASSIASINLSTFGLVQGQEFSIYDVMNPFGAAVYSGRFNSGSPTVSIPLTGTVVQSPIGFTPAGGAASKTSSEFKTFVVVPTVK